MSRTRGRLNQQPLIDSLPALLAERGLSLRALADRVGIGHSHLSRALRRANGKTVSGELVYRIAAALDLPDGYFPEQREALVVERIHADAALRDRLYQQLARSS